MEQWHLRNHDLKKYPHFVPPLSAEEGEAYATDENRVAHHAFFPFIQYWQRWTRFPKKNAKEPLKPKNRPIRYAARRDAYIFSYYRFQLSQLYEAELRRRGLEGSILAYRRLPTSTGQRGKCNIHFAFDAFLKIRELGDCCAIALDISDFFESLDHSRLKRVWCAMLGVDRLPADHFKVFKAVTKYAWVEKVDAYKRLGYFGVKRTINGKPIKGYLKPYREIPTCLCDGKTFREKIAGDSAEESIIKCNPNTYGIPQGAPISDLLANLYLIDFDSTVAGWVRELGGAYFRYSDDILILVPGGGTTGRDFMERIRGLIGNFGVHLMIKREKSSLLVFQRNGAEQNFQLLDGAQGEHGLEYLGFRYDGRRIYLRDPTLSNLLRKIVRAAHREAEVCAKRYPDKDVDGLKKLFNYERLIRKFGRAEDFGKLQSKRRSWTFWTYAKRASSEFATMGKPILHQLKKHREFIRRKADEALSRAVIRRERRRALRTARR